MVQKELLRMWGMSSEKNHWEHLGFDKDPISLFFPHEAFLKKPSNAIWKIDSGLTPPQFWQESQIYSFKKTIL